MNFFRRGFIHYGLGKINYGNISKGRLYQFNKTFMYTGLHRRDHIHIRRLCTNSNANTNPIPKQVPPIKPEQGGSGSGSGPATDAFNVTSAQNQYFEFEQKLMASFAMNDKKKARQLIYGGISIFFVIFIFYESLKSYFSKQTAEAVSVTLQQDEVQKETDKLAKQITASVLKDKATYDYINEITNGTIRDESTQKALQQMLYAIYLDPEFQIKTKEFVRIILADESIQEQVTDILTQSVKDILDDNSTRTYAKEALVEIMDSEEFLQETYVSAWSVWKRLCTFGLWK